MSCFEIFARKRIPVIENLIAQYEAAMLEFADGVQTYTIDDGQTKTTVSKAQMGEIRNTLSNLYSQLEVLYTRVGCDTGGSTISPNW